MLFSFRTYGSLTLLSWLFLSSGSVRAQSAVGFGRHGVRASAGIGMIMDVPARTVGVEYSYTLTPRWRIGASGLYGRVRTGPGTVDYSEEGHAWIGEVHTTFALAHGVKWGLEARGGAYLLAQRTTYGGFNSAGRKAEQQAGALLAMRATRRLSSRVTLDLGPEMRFYPEVRGPRYYGSGHTSRQLFLFISAQLAAGISVRL